jgi:hypothetical protein
VSFRGVGIMGRPDCPDLNLLIKRIKSFAQLAGSHCVVGATSEGMHNYLGIALYIYEAERVWVWTQR